MVNKITPLIKTILTDLDGTAVKSLDNNVPLSVSHVLDQAREKGIQVSAVTGRPFEVALPLLKAMKLDGYNVVDGGATITLGYTGEIVWTCELTVEKVRAVVTILKKYARVIHYDNAVGGISDVDTIDVDAIDRPYAHAWAAVDVVMVDRVMGDISSVEGVVAHANPGPGGDFSLTGIQVTDSNADKMHGVRKLMEYLHTTKEETLGVGDGNNDLPLFAMSAVKVAMGNSPTVLKEAADYVVSPVDRDGFVEAVNIGLQSYSHAA
jgi:hydroxymethylpyrimidine pyrophosphatase-like HAD family hydrolase